MTLKIYLIFLNAGHGLLEEENATEIVQRCIQRNAFSFS